MQKKINTNKFFFVLKNLFVAGILFNLIYSCKKDEVYKIETYKIGDSYGYTIKKNGHNFIKQDDIPAVPGNKKFKTEKDALNTAGIMKEKLNKGKFPTVNTKELDSLHVQY